MLKRTVAASEFEARCLELLDDVAQNGHELVITRRGKPVARVVPAEPPRSLVGSVEFLVSDDELIAPLHEEWEPTFEE